MLLRQATKLGPALECIGNQHLHVSFSQFGEDLVLWSILSTRRRLDKKGFYVDIGAHDPWAHSNTALLWLFRDWSGINIDANPQSIERFKRVRPNDQNIVAAVSDEEIETEYVMFNHSGVNTLDPQMRERQTNAPHGQFQVESVVKVATRRLERILDEVIPRGTEIDVMSVDVEGFDLKVLRSNDWSRFRPFMVLVETHGMDLTNVSANPVYAFLRQQRYKLVSHCFVTSFFVRE